MRIVVAGGTGFLGRRVVATLLAAGHRVTVLARRNRGTLPEGARLITADLGQAPVPADSLTGHDAVVNLVGIKMGSEAEFRAAHVHAVRHLVDAAGAAEVERFVHVSVAGVEELGDGPYPATKRAGEEVVRDCELMWTILRPGPIYGPGDDVIRNVVRGLWIAPPFPLPDGGRGRLGLVDVEAVATAVLRTLERPDTAGATLDVVGPERTVRELVTDVAHALELPVVLVPVPAAVLRPAVTLMEKLLGDPLITGSQLTMLGRGLTGDPLPAQHALDLTPGPLSPERIRSSIPAGPALGFRLSPTPEHARSLRSHAPAFARSLLVTLIALVAMLVLPAALPHVWWRMLAVEGAAAALALALVPLPWRTLLRPRADHVAVGLVAAAVLYGIGWIAATQAIPAAQMSGDLGELLRWRGLLPLPLALALLAPIVLAEDLVWRLAVTLPAASRLGPLAGALLGATAFAVAHLTSGPPLLALAALGCGFAWSLLAVRTNGLWAPFACHLTWDVLVLFVAPYPAG